MKIFAFVLLVILTSFDGHGQKTPKKDSIQIAFLLDVSGSMDVLIQKAKSQIWRIGSYLGSATKDGRKTSVQFSVITYGFEDETESPKILIGFNSNLDSVVMQLYDLQTSGGNYFFISLKEYKSCLELILLTP